MLVYVCLDFCLMVFCYFVCIMHFLLWFSLLVRCSICVDCVLIMFVLVCVVVLCFVFCLLDRPLAYGVLILALLLRCAFLVVLRFFFNIWWFLFSFLLCISHTLSSHICIFSLIVFSSYYLIDCFLVFIFYTISRQPTTPSLPPSPSFLHFFLLWR